MRLVRSASELPMALMCSTSMGCFLWVLLLEEGAIFACDSATFARRTGLRRSVLQERFEALCQVLRLVVVQHVACG